MLIVLDPGHGGRSRANVGPTGYVEADGVLDIGLRLRDLLTPHYDVFMTREADVTVGLYDRPAMANELGADLFVSLHTNAGAANVRGAETYHSRNGEWGSIFHDEAKRAAEQVQRELVKATGLIDRGTKTWLVNNPGSPIHGMDYLAVIRRAKMPALLVEAGFHSNLQDEALLKTPEFRQKIAEGIFKGIKAAYPVGTPIFGQAQATLEQAREYMRQRNPGYVFIADLFWEIAPKYKLADGTPMRPDIPFVQSCKETGQFRFGGLVKPWQCNTAGIAATGTASDGNTALRGADPTKVRFEKGVHGAIFADWPTGVEAQVQHLWAYATKEQLPSWAALLSPRFTLVPRGTAPIVEQLGAAENPSGVGWANPGVDYGKSIVRDYMARLIATVAPDKPDADAELLRRIQQLEEQNASLEGRIVGMRESFAVIESEAGKHSG